MRRDDLEAAVLDGLQNRLMEPAHGPGFFARNTLAP
jgi:hypothetical protein